jgi:hypothetical protein
MADSPPPPASIQSVLGDTVTLVTATSFDPSSLSQPANTNETASNAVAIIRVRFFVKMVLFISVTPEKYINRDYVPARDREKKRGIPYYS